MKVGMLRANSGESYFNPCLIERDFKSRRAVRGDVSQHKEADAILGLRAARTSHAFHPALPPLVQQPNAKADVNLHLLLLKLTGKAVLHDDVCRVLYPTDQHHAPPAGSRSDTSLTAPNL